MKVFILCGSPPARETIQREYGARVQLAFQPLAGSKFSTARITGMLTGNDLVIDCLKTLPSSTRAQIRGCGVRVVQANPTISALRQVLDAELRSQGQEGA